MVTDNNLIIFFICSSRMHIDRHFILALFSFYDKKKIFYYYFITRDILNIRIIRLYHILKISWFDFFLSAQTEEMLDCLFTILTVWHILIVLSSRKVYIIQSRLNIAVKYWRLYSIIALMPASYSKWVSMYVLCQCVLIYVPFLFRFNQIVGLFISYCTFYTNYLR